MRPQKPERVLHKGIQVARAYSTKLQELKLQPVAVITTSGDTIRGILLTVGYKVAVLDVAGSNMSVPIDAIKSVAW
jgi:hypothetical protein